MKKSKKIKPVKGYDWKVLDEREQTMLIKMRTDIQIAQGVYIKR